MSSRQSDMETKIRQYWIASRQWRGDTRFGMITTGDLLKTLADLAGGLMNIGWRPAEYKAAELLQQVINNKRCRKTKGPNNVVNLHKPKIELTGTTTGHWPSREQNIKVG